jgi:hypothetical protein
MRKRRVTRDDDPELEIDYGTAESRDLDIKSTDRLCFFTLRAEALCSHYFLFLPATASGLKGQELKRYLFENLMYATHFRTCEKTKP